MGGIQCQCDSLGSVGSWEGLMFSQGRWWCGDCVFREIERLQAIVKPLDELRADEGSTVLIPCDNPEPSDPTGCYVEVADEWTEWRPRSFAGENLIEALVRAVEAKREAAEVARGSM